MASKFHSIVMKEITSNRNISKQINFINCFHSSRQKSQFWYPYCRISVTVSVRHTVSVTESCTFAFKLQRFRVCLSDFSNQSDPTKLLNFASFSHSLRNIHSLYPRGIMPIQSRRKLINALKLDTNPSHIIRAKMRDESTCHWEPSFRGAERRRRIIYVGRSHWPFALRRHFGTRSELLTRPTAAEHSFGSCSDRAFFYRMLSDGQILLIPYANIRPK